FEKAPHPGVTRQCRNAALFLAGKYCRRDERQIVPGDGPFHIDSRHHVPADQARHEALCMRNTDTKTTILLWGDYEGFAASVACEFPVLAADRNAFGQGKSREHPAGSRLRRSRGAARIDAIAVPHRPKMRSAFQQTRLVPRWEGPLLRPCTVR